MKILKNLCLSLSIIIFSVSASPLSGIFAAEEETTLGQSSTFATLIPTVLLAEIGKFLPPEDLDNFRMTFKKVGHCRIPPFQHVLVLRSNHKRWLGHLPKLKEIPYIVIYIKNGENIENDDVMLYFNSLLNIKELHVHHPHLLKENSLKDMSKLTLLQELTLHDQHDVTDKSLECLLPCLSALQRLRLHYMQSVTCTGLQHLKYLSVLQRLELHSLYHVKDTGLGHLKCLSTLKCLVLNDLPQVRNLVPQHLKDLPDFRCLVLKGGSMCSPNLHYLSGLTSLQHLVLSRIGPCYELLSGLWALQELELIDMVNLSSLTYLSGLTNLRRLVLSTISFVRDQVLQHLRDLTALRHLELRDISVERNQPLQHLRGLKALEHLVLENIRAGWLGEGYNLIDRDLQHLRDLTALKTLQLCAMPTVTDEGLQHLSGLPALKTLRLCAMPMVTDEGLQHLSGLPALRVLELKKMVNVTDASSVRLLKFTRL